MHRIDHATAAPGDFFTEGNPATATPATTVTDDWLNDVQENICDVIENAGLALAKGDYTQLRQAIQAMLIASQKAVVINNATFEASVVDGEVVRWDSANSRFDEAVADGTDNNRAVGVADVTNSKVYLYGECPLFSGLTPGARYYLDGSTAGAITATATAPTDTVKVGVAKSSTVLWVDIDHAASADLQHGQCVLEKSGANLLLKPRNGNKLIINGASYSVPAAGITLAATGLTPGTLYYIYAYMSGGTMTLEASATGHSTDATTGVEIKTGDATRTLVGMARPITGPAWQDAAAQRFVRSWFNRQRLTGYNAFAANRTTTSMTYVEMSSAERAEFLVWSAESVVFATGGGMQSTYGGFDIMYISIGIDSSTPEDCVCMGDDTSASGITPVSCSLVKSGLAEGYHYATILAHKTQTATMTMFGAASGPDRCTINFSIH